MLSRHIHFIFSDEFSVDVWIIFGHPQIYLSGISSFVLAVSIWGNVAVNVSVEVASDARMDGVSDDDAWSEVKWYVVRGRDQRKGLCVGPFLID